MSLSSVKLGGLKLSRGNGGITGHRGGGTRPRIDRIQAYAFETDVMRPSQCVVVHAFHVRKLDQMLAPWCVANCTIERRPVGLFA